jgi:hypothetical protein
MANSNIDDVLNSLKGDAAAQVKQQVQQVMTEAKGDSNAFVQSNATQLEEWLVDLSNGDLSEDEFDDLVADQKVVAANFVLEQSVGAQQRAEALTVNLLELAVTKVVPLLL